MRRDWMILAVVMVACQFDGSTATVAGEAETLGAASTSGTQGPDGTTSTGPVGTSDTPPNAESTATSESPMETTDPTEVSSGDSTTGLGTTTEPAEPHCGDARLGDNEDCDDGNLDELDGCTSTCRVGPIGIEGGQLAELSDRFGGYATGDLNTVTDCASDERLVGLRGVFSYYAQYFVLARLQGICAPIDLLDQAPTAIDFGPTTVLTEVGTFSSGRDSQFEILCPADAVVSGLEGFGGLYTDRVGLRCRTVALTDDASEFELGPRESGPSFGASGGGSSQLVSCPATSLAAGFRVQGDAYATGIYLRCQETELAFSR